MYEKSNQFKLVHQNIRSMRRNTDRLFAYVDSVKERPLIIGLSETWISDEEINNYRVDGYNLYVNGNNANRSGGVAIYAVNNLNCKQVNYDFTSFNAIGLTFSLNSNLVCVVCLYRFGYMSLSTFSDDFMIFIHQLSHANLLILGDFNIDFLRPSAVLDNFLVLLADYGLDVLVSEPTRITDSSATCIDNVIYRIDLRHFQKVTSTVLDLKITDHCLIEVNLSPNFQCSTSNSNHRFEVTQTDYNKLKNVLIFEDWSTVFNCRDASVAFDSFIKIFYHHFNSCTRKLIRRNQHKSKPWMSNYLLKLIRQRNKFCMLSKKHPNNGRLKNYSLKFCELVNEKINLTKKQYYVNQFYLNGKSARKNWGLVNEIITGCPVTADIKEIINQSGCSTTDSSTIANEFNMFFTNVGLNNSLTLDMPNIEKERLIQENNVTINSFYFSPITSCELYYVINSLKNKSSPGIDGITNSVVKHLACFLVDVLSFIFNLSVETGIFPVSLKRAVVIPIFKKNDRSCLNNYRPISLLSVFSKIFEKVMKKRIIGFINANNLFSNSQYGFREHRNTEQALLSFLDQVTNTMDNGHSASALFIDMTKAFDRVQHSTLLKKLSRWGFRDAIQRWLKSYLNGRTQCVRLNGLLSNELVVKMGVPQGSVLGPLLFLVYINGIFEQQFKGSLTAFADDVSFTYAGLDVSHNNDSIKLDLELLSLWLKAHNFLLSDKTKIMHFKERNSSNTSTNYHAFGCNRKVPCVSSGCFPVYRVNEFKYLGVLIDAKLNWKSQVESLKSKLLLVARKMYVLRIFCPKYLLRIVYCALVESLLQYGLTCWGGACQTTLRSVFVRQKHIIRIMSFKARQDASWPIFQALELLPLQHLYVFKVLKLFFIISGNDYVNLADYNLRSNFQFMKKIPKFRLDLRRSSFSVISPILFNNLPYEIRMCNGLSVFSKTLKSWLKQTQNIQHLFS